MREERKYIDDYFRNIFKPKSNDDIQPSYYRLEEKEQQYSDLQVN
jgi:hypothetical protein